MNTLQDDVQLKNLGVRVENLTERQRTLEEAADTATTTLAEAAETLDAVELAEALGDATPRQVERKRHTLEQADGAAAQARSALPSKQSLRSS